VKLLGGYIPGAPSPGRPDHRESWSERLQALTGLDLSHPPSPAPEHPVHTTPAVSSPSLEEDLNYGRAYLTTA